jgi:type VI secretion system secreted protein VgrG
VTEVRQLMFTLEVDGFAARVLSSGSFIVEEQLFGTYRVHFTVAVEEWIDQTALIGKDATVRLAIDSATERTWSGIVGEASIRMARDDRFELEFAIVSRLALLELGRNSKIFQDKSVVDIVTELLEGADVTHEWKTTGTYSPRPYVVQYNESDYDFMRRLLVDEGIGFAIENDDGATVIFFDDDSAYQPILGGETLFDKNSTDLDSRLVWSMDEEFRLGSDAAMLRDYDAAKPGLDLSVKAAGPSSVGREVYDHPGGFNEVGAGQPRVDRMLERLMRDKRTFRGQSNAPELAPGHTFTVVGHPRASLNERMLVVEVMHVGAVGGALSYEATFVAIPVDVPYRPVHAPRKPELGGVQNAFVTGPGGAEIHCSEVGGIKVRFPWDRSGITDDRSSTWLRTGQVALGGPMILPRVGFEVLVDFELGDLDRPMIAGHLYNGEAMPPYALPGGAVRSSFQTATLDGGPSANELRFDDTAGSEEIFLNASKDWTHVVDNDSTFNVTKNETWEIGSNRTCKVGKNHQAQVVGNETVKVAANQTITIGKRLSDGLNGSYTLKVGANRKVQVGADLVEEVGGTFSRKVGSIMSFTGIAGISRRVSGNSTTKVSAAWLEIVGKSRMVSVGGSYIETIGALKLVKAKSVSVSATGGYIMNAGMEKVDIAGNRNDSAKGAFAMTAAGKISVKAKVINIAATSKLTVRAGAVTIELTSSGAVTIKAPTVEVKNAKALTQAMHQSA